MKKILFALSIGFSSIATLSNCSYAQNAAMPVAFNDTKNFKASVRDIAALESLSTLGTYIPDAKTINTRAAKDFSARFNSVSNAMWFSDKNGFVSYFVQDGFGNHVFYDKKGRWQYSLIFHSEDKLPKDLRAAVRSTYYDMAITLVEEVQTNDGTGYVIYLEDKSNIKILKVNREGEIGIMQELEKQ
jgi:hypothetical protein